MQHVDLRAMAAAGGPGQPTAALAEAERLMTVCNSCRYCEGLCAVFPAMEMRRAFPSGDLNYIANLCHACGACYYDCQFSPPHEFNVNVPRVLAQVRNDSYGQLAWPPAMSVVFRNNALWISGLTTASVAAFILGFLATRRPDLLFSVQTGPGAFYRVMPHALMATLFGAAFLYAALALTMSVRTLWRGIAEPLDDGEALGALWDGSRDAATLRYLDGGKAGCFNADDKPSDARRRYHHLTFYGFLLCFASTSTASLYHFAGREAPYPLWDLPVVLGTLGGVGLVIGTAGLLVGKLQRDPMMVDRTRRGMDIAFIAMLFLTGATGLVLLALRATPAMHTLLAVHLGVVFALFLTLPYGKFVHGIYRWAALVRYGKERRRMMGGAAVAPVSLSGQGGKRK